MKTIETMIAAFIGGFVLPAFQFMYGEGMVRYYVMFLILLLVAMDWIAGSRASKKDHTYASEYGFEGLWRTIFILLVPAVGHLLDQIFSLNGYIFGALSFGTMYHIMNSMTANSVRAGWGRWIPNKMIAWVASEIEHKVARSIQRRKERDDILKGDEE